MSSAVQVEALFKPGMLRIGATESSLNLGSCDKRSPKNGLRLIDEEQKDTSTTTPMRYKIQNMKVTKGCMESPSHHQHSVGVSPFRVSK